MNQQLSRVGEKARALVLGSNLNLAEAVDQAIDDLADSAQITDESGLALEALAELDGFGPLTLFLADQELEELWMNRPGELFVHSAGRTSRHEIAFTAEQQRIVIDRMLRSIGRRIDRSSPFVDAPLPDGSRLHVVIPDITRESLSFNIRRFVQNRATLQSLHEQGVLSVGQLNEIRAALRERKTIVVSGATAAGKTTMLCAMLRELDETERVVSVEDTFEISIPNPDWVAMQTRPASIEGRGEIDLRRLIREALRMRPSRLVVGEVRGAEAIELLVALNSGIPALCTVHANSAQEAFGKLQTLPLLSGVNVPVEFLRQVLAEAVGLVVHCSLGVDGRRRVESVEKVA
jgi:pilus assembly protein CpaF